jgi:hypothetical protein
LTQATFVAAGGVDAIVLVLFAAATRENTQWLTVAGQLGSEVDMSGGSGHGGDDASGPQMGCDLIKLGCEFVTFVQSFAYSLNWLYASFHRIGLFC